MIYTKTCEYALRSLSCFVKEPKGASLAIDRISRRAGVPGAYVSKVFQCLVRRGILESHRGALGGYSLKIEPKKLTLIRVIRALDDLDNSPLSNCIMGLHDCSDAQPCPLHHVWMGAKEKMLKKLTTHTIADIADLVDGFESGRLKRGTLSSEMRKIFAT